MSLPTNLQNGLSISDYGVITTPNQPIDLNRNSIIATTNATSFNSGSTNILQSINERLAANQINQFRFPLDLPKYNFTIIQHDSSTATIGGRRVIGRVTGVYRLPLPTRLVDSHQTEFVDISPLDVSANIGKFGFGLYRANRIASIARTLRTKEKSRGRVLGPKKAQERAEKIDDRTFETIDRGINAVENSGGIIDTIGFLAGIKLSKGKIVSIKDPAFRSFALKWHFVPKSYQESVQLQKICYNLRKNMTPASEGKYQYVSVFPSIYTMFFQPNVKFLYKFKPCVLTSITVDYESGGVPAFYKPENGNSQLSPPESVILTTTWLELDQFVRQHYTNDHDDNEDLPSSDPYGMLRDSFTFTSGG